MDQEIIMDETLMDQEIMDETEQRKANQDFRKRLHSSANHLKTDTDWLIDNLKYECRLEELKKNMDEYRGKIYGLKQKSSYEDAVLTYLKDVESKLSDLLKELSEGSNIQQHVIEFVQWQKGEIEELKKFFLCQQDNSPFRYSLTFDDISNSLLGNTQEEYANAREINPTELVAQLNEKREFITSLRTTMSKGIVAPEVNDVGLWKRCIQEWYPDLHSKTYFLPPLFFHRDDLVERTGFKIPLLIKKLSSTDDSDMRGDKAQEEVLRQLRKLSNYLTGEAMMVISQLQFGTYFRGASYTPAAACFLKNKAKPLPDHQEGDFDILIIHPKHGIIIGEIKSVGAIRNEQPLHNIIRERVDTAIYQLAKSETVIRHLVDDPAEVNVMKTIFLPFLSSSEFVRAVGKDNELLMHLRRTLGTDFPEDVCFLQDTPLKEWWHLLTSSTRNAMTPSQYEDNVVRFCGPVKTVDLFCVTSPQNELRTEGEGVAETGNRIARFTLLDSQLNLINTKDELNRLVFLTGPPGTGKTVVLIFKALKWLQNGYTVHLVSPWYKSVASTLLIEYQLLMTTPKTELIRHNYNFTDYNDVCKAIGDLMNARNKNKKFRLNVIMDEAGPDLREDAVRMFPRDAVWHTYKTPMEKKTAIRMFQKRFSMRREDAENLLLNLPTSESKLSLYVLHKLYVDYTVANRLRQKHGQNIFRDCALTEESLTKAEAIFMLEDKFFMKHDEAVAQFDEITKQQGKIQRTLTIKHFQSVYKESETIKCSREEQARKLFTELTEKVERVLPRTEAICMLKRRLKFTDDDAEAEFNAHIKKDHMDLTHFQRIYFTHEKAEEHRKEHIRSLFKKYCDKKTLQKKKAIDVLKNVFHPLCDGQAEEMYSAVGNFKKGPFSQDLFKEFYFKSNNNYTVITHRENHSKELYFQYCRYYVQFIKKSELIKGLQSIKSLTQDAVKALSESLQDAKDDMCEADFTKLYAQNIKLLKLEAREQFYLCLKKYKRRITKCNLLNALENNFHVPKEIVRTAFSNIKQASLDILEFRRFYAQKREFRECREYFARYIFEESLRNTKYKMMPRTNVIELLKKHFTMTENTAVSTFEEIKNGENDKLTLEEFETFYNKYTTMYTSKENYFSEFCEGLLRKVPDVCLWTAAIERHTKPICLREEILTISLRTTPNVMKQVSLSDQITGGFVLGYTLSAGVAGTDGPKHICLFHKVEQDENNDVLLNCEECGKNIVDVLKSLRVGETNLQSSPSLEYRDVLVVCDNPLDENGLVRFLRTTYPVRVVSRKQHELDKIKDTVLAFSNQVTVSHYRHVHGLERKIVIVVGNPDEKSDFSRLYNMSRTISQLVLIWHKYNHA